MLAGHSHVSGVVLQFEDGRGEAEPLVAVPSQDVPLRNNVVRRGTHQLVAISTPTAHAHTHTSKCLKTAQTLPIYLKFDCTMHLTTENTLGGCARWWSLQCPAWGSPKWQCGHRCSPRPAGSPSGWMCRWGPCWYSPECHLPPDNTNWADTIKDSRTTGIITPAFQKEHKHGMTISDLTNHERNEQENVDSLPRDSFARMTLEGKETRVMKPNNKPTRWEV